MNKRIYDILNNYINDYQSRISHEIESNVAIFRIFDTYFHKLINNKKLQKDTGIKLLTPLINNITNSSFSVMDNSFGQEGISFLVEFKGTLFTLRLKRYRQQQEMIHEIYVQSYDDTKYSGEFMYKYLLFNALESSKLKGSYFTMPRDVFDWEIKNMELKTFDDIFLPDDIMEDLNLYVDIYEKHDRILRYLMVGNPGVGKTEATIIMFNMLNKMGVTVIKTPICKTLHDKVELANVLAPSLIIFDDIDLSLGDRNKGAYSTLLGDFLDVLDGTDKMAKNVGVIATTNAAHLLDLAAQRPGRFDKTLLFDNINQDNIEKIILKSLKENFNITKGKEVNLYTNKKIVDAFYDAAVSGAHIYNGIMMLKLRYETLGITDINVSRVLASIQSEIDTIKKIRKVSYLKEKYERESSGIGFKTSEPEDDESYADEIHTDAPVREGSGDYGATSKPIKINWKIDVNGKNLKG